jgi:hypothetical protein
MFGATKFLDGSNGFFKGQVVELGKNLFYCFCLLMGVGKHMKESDHSNTRLVMKMLSIPGEEPRGES